jgi:hypothetical protein
VTLGFELGSSHLLGRAPAHTMEFYSTTKKNETMWFDGKWVGIEGCDIK